MKLEDYTHWNLRKTNQRKGNRSKKWGNQNVRTYEKESESRARLVKLCFGRNVD